MGENGIGFTFVIGGVQIWIHFEPRDLWFGVYWNRERDYKEVYVCLVPLIPIRFLWMTTSPDQIKQRLDDAEFDEDYD